MRYFIGNWKMFGVPTSIGILNKINSYYSKDKNRNKKDMWNIFVNLLYYSTLQIRLFGFDGTTCK